MKRLFLLCIFGIMTITVNAQGYVDLGLSSGTLWKQTNEYGHYTAKEAKSQFGTNLPSKYQWQELRSECKWTWTGNGYKVTGPNGNHIHLPLAGVLNGRGDVVKVSQEGAYWTSTIGYGTTFLDITKNEITFRGGGGSDWGRSVRLVQNY